MIKKVNLLNFTIEKMKDFCNSLGFEKFVYIQIIDWIYKKYCFDFMLMNNLSLNIRNLLFKIAEIRVPKIVKEFISCDGVKKWLLDVNGDCIETVYIPELNRNTLCLSTQVGCLVNCLFCATGKQKFKRNLNVSEIIGQLLLVLFLSNKNINNSNKYISNIVFMGMGEPLLNFNNVVNSIKIIINKNCLFFSKRKIVLSTSGIVPYIYKLVNYVDVILVLSLHASNDFLRNKLVPVNKKYNISSLLKSIIFYIKKTKSNRGKIYIEYIMLYKINDYKYHAYELVQLFKNLSVKINLIIFNDFNKNKYLLSSNLDRINFFSDILKRNNIFVTIRKVRGIDINASCGQLVGNLK